MAIFTVDGRAFNVVATSLQRKASVLDGQNAGRVLSGRMERDIIGTYYNYTIELDTRNMDVAEYDSLYEALTAPVKSHTLVAPYGQGTISFEAYVTGADDTLKIMTPEKNLWGGLRINFVAMEPKRYPE